MGSACRSQSDNTNTHFCLRYCTSAVTDGKWLVQNKQALSWLTQRAELLWSVFCHCQSLFLLFLSFVCCLDEGNEETFNLPVTITVKAALVFIMEVFEANRTNLFFKLQPNTSLLCKSNSCDAAISKLFSQHRLHRSKGNMWYLHFYIFSMTQDTQKQKDPL